MTETPEPEPAAEWEPDEPDTAPAAPADPTKPTAQRDGVGCPNGKWIETEPRNREQRYRQQLRATEAERDQLRERLERRDRNRPHHR
jgi:hypothetical protein